MTEHADSPMKKNDKTIAGVLGIVAAGVLAGMIYGLYLVMPILVSLAKNTIIFFVELAVLVFLVLGAVQLWSERDLLIYKWKNIVRSIRRAIIREDPIGILNTAIQRFDARLEQIDARIAEAVGAKTTQLNGIRKTEKLADDEEALAGAAKRLNKSDREIGQHAMASQRWRAAADSMRPLADLMTNMQASLEGARDLARTKLDDLQNQKAVLSVRLETAQSGKKAVRSLKMFFGSNTDSDMADMAFDEIERQTNEAEAEIDQFMRVMDPVLATADLKKQAETMRAMDKFNAFKENAQHALPAPVSEGIIVEPQTLHKELVNKK